MMPIIRGIRKIKWNLSWKNLKALSHSLKTLFTDETKLDKWFFVYSLILLPILNYLVVFESDRSLISIGSSFYRIMFSRSDLIPVTILILLTICIFIISLKTYNKVKPLLFASLFSQILIMFFEINIIIRYSFNYQGSIDMTDQISMFFSLSLLIILLKVISIIYMRIKTIILFNRDLRKLESGIE